MNDPANLLCLAGISKSYSTRVLADVRFDLRAGEIHALVGENGAGKSTLARIIAGLTKPDSGHMDLAGRRFIPRDKSDAEEQGVRLVMQELNLIGTLSVAENIFFDRMPHRWGWIEYEQLNAQARPLMEKVGLQRIDPARPVKSLGVGQQQLVEIAAGISRRCRILILDEPTAALTAPEIERLFGQIRKLKAAGVGMIYISHRLEEIQALADRITVLRDGAIVATRETQSISLDEVVRLMVGRDLGEVMQRPAHLDGTLALRVEGLRVPPTVRDVSFDLRRGEILGFAGLMGSGRTETMRALFGADRPESGRIYLHGSSEPTEIRSPTDAVRHGIALLTEDRKAQGLLLPLAVRANISLLCLDQVSCCHGWIQREKEGVEARRWVNALSIRCTNTEQPVAQLSGGNQQKVVIAKWLFRNCDILIFDEPTRGIDVGAKFEIYKLLADLATQGKAIALVSSDLKELLMICDRIAVMSAGRVAASFVRGDWTEEKIMTAALSGYMKQRTHAEQRAS